MGKGFYFEDGKVFTKYSSGLAVLTLPFFLVAHAASLIFDLEPDGFGPLYFKMTNITAAFYLSLGLLYLFWFLKKYFSKSTAFLTTFMVVAGTNLFYYSISDTFMSHTYSFALISMFLFYLKRFIDNESKATKYWIIISILLALITLIRIPNIIIILFIPFLDIHRFSDLKRRLSRIFKIKYILISLFSFFLIFLPQMLYWKFISGSYLFYSYGNEGFIFWNNPKILEVLFSTNNGLVPYSPVYLAIFLGILFMLFKKSNNGILVLITFLLLTYICASWYCFNFGCSYGMRPFIDFLAVFAIGLATFIKSVTRIKHWLIRITSIVLLSFFAYINISLTYAYDKCFYGSTWDWYAYKKYFRDHHILPLNAATFQWHYDFENPAMAYLDESHKIPTYYEKAFSGVYVTQAGLSSEFASIFKANMFNILSHPITDISVSAEVLSKDHIERSYIVVTFQQRDSTIYWQSIALAEKVKETEKWINVSQRFTIPDLPRDAILKVYLWCPEKKEVYLDDLNLDFEY